MRKTLFELFLTGILFGSGPCVSSCGPLLISYIAANKKSITSSLLVYFLYSLARISVYLILSLAIFSLGEFTTTKFLQGLYGYIFIIGGLFIIVIGLFMIFEKTGESRLCRIFKDKFIVNDKKSVLALGILAGLLPCAPFLAVLSYIGMISKNWANSLYYSFSFGLGTFLSPLLLIAVILGIFPKFKFYNNPFFSKIISSISGVIIIFLGARLILLAR